MSTCPNCGKEVPSDVKFCINCGASLISLKAPVEAKTEILPQSAGPAYAAAPQVAQQAPQVAQPAAKPVAPNQNPAGQPYPGRPAQPAAPAAYAAPQKQPYNLVSHNAQAAEQPLYPGPGTKAPETGKKASKGGKNISGIVIASILAVACIGLVIALVFTYLSLASLKKNTDQEISELKTDLSQSQVESANWQSKYEDKKEEYDKKVTSYNALNSSYIEMNKSWELMHKTLSEMSNYNNEITFESDVYSVKVGETLWIEGEWTGYSTNEVFMGTDYYNNISVEWENIGNTPYIKTTGLQPGVAIIKLGSDEYCTVNPFALVVIVYE